MKKVSLLICMLFFGQTITTVAQTGQWGVPEKEKKPACKQEKLFSGFYFKGGLMVSPDTGSFSDKWLLSLGFDCTIGKYLTWGLEFQPYYRSFTSGDDILSLQEISLNAFLNLKGGLNLGQLLESLKFITFYGGLGIGTNLTYCMIEMEGVSGNQFDPYLAWHFIFGAEFELGKISLVVEFQGNKIILTDVDPATLSLDYLMVGIRF